MDIQHRLFVWLFALWMALALLIAGPVLLRDPMARALGERLGLPEAVLAVPPGPTHLNFQ